MCSRGSTVKAEWARLAFEVIDTFTVENTSPVLNSGLGASEESNHIDYIRRCFALLLYSGHGVRHTLFRAINGVAWGEVYTLEYLLADDTR